MYKQQTKVYSVSCSRGKFFADDKDLQIHAIWQQILRVKYVDVYEQ